MNSVKLSLRRFSRIVVVAICLSPVVVASDDSSGQKSSPSLESASNPTSAKTGNNSRRERPTFWQGDQSLTAEQRQLVQKAFESFRRENRSLLERSNRVRRELEDAVFATPIDTALIQSKAAEWGQLEGDVAVARAKMIDALRPQLSAAQLARLKSLRGDLTLAERFPVRGDGSQNPSPVERKRKNPTDAESAVTPPAKE